MKTVTIDSMLVVDDTGMPVPPTIRQLLDRDIRTLYTRDKSKDKKQYIAECIVIYQLGDPKSPARQSGLSEKAVLPTEGLAAIIIRSERCHPYVFLSIPA